MITIRHRDERGHFDHGWLNTEISHRKAQRGKAATKTEAAANLRSLFHKTK